MGFGGVFRCSADLREKYGENVYISTCIGENVYISTCIGENVYISIYMYCSLTSECCLICSEKQGIKIHL